ncbi:MAG: ChaN family lipoprotein [Bdellovibrionales bacterium]
MGFWVLGLLLSTCLATPSGVPQQEAIWNTQDQTWLSLHQVSHNLRAGSIVVFGEEHAISTDPDPIQEQHHLNQQRWLQALGSRAEAPSDLGMEFLEYTHQGLVDGFLAGDIETQTFLQLVGWGSNPFAPYERLMREAFSWGGRVLGLNIPKTIARHVSQSGPEALSDGEKALLPPIWERGGDFYFERFSETMTGHVPQEKIERYFWAQSLWDDTMAWTTSQNARPNGIFTIIVGAFHAEFGQGLPARLIRHGVNPSRIKTLLQVHVENWEPETLAAAVAPDARYGASADYIWVYK